MKNAVALLSVLCLAGTIAAQQPGKKLKVYISVDMEGVSGVVSSDQTGAGGADYNRFRRLMTEETNAAIEGAVTAGATEIVVNDSHGSMRNIEIENLRAPAELISNSVKPMGMMQGIDPTFDAVIFVGYHAKAGSPTGVIAHTGTGTIADVRVNGRSVGEAGINTFAAGSLGVPVIMITGDQEAVAQARELVPNIEGVQVKEAIGSTAARSLRPEEARARIRAGAERALKRRAEFQAITATTPTIFEVSFTQTVLADIAEQIPTVNRVDAKTVSYRAQDYLQGYRLLRLLYRYLRAD